jgi:hypothetical protein
MYDMGYLCGVIGLLTLSIYILVLGKSFAEQGCTEAVVNPSYWFHTS